MSADDRLRAALLLSPEERLAAFVDAHEKCEHHGLGPCEGPVGDVRPMTAYGHEPARYRMCTTHAEEYVAEWAERWDDYYAGLL